MCDNLNPNPLFNQHQLYQNLAVVFTCTGTNTDGVHFNHCSQLIEAVRVKGDGAVVRLGEGGIILNRDREGLTAGVHKREGNAGDT